MFYFFLVKPFETNWNPLKLSETSVSVWNPLKLSETLWICCFDTNVTCNSYKNVRLYLLQMGEWTQTEYHSYYCHFQFSENGDTKTVWFSWFFLHWDFFLRNFALGKWFTITVSHIWCEMFSTSIWHSLFPSCESYGQVCTRNSEDTLLSAHVRIRRL